MELVSRPVQTPFQPLDACGIQWGLLGRVTSPRGVQIVATDGLPNGRTENNLTAVSAVLGYSMRMPRDLAIGTARRPFQSIGRLNYYSPGVSLRLRSGGPITLALCFLSADFLASLSETEAAPRLGDLGLLTSIESDRLAFFSQAMFREAIAPGFASSLFAESVGLAIAAEIAQCDGARRLEGIRRGGLAGWRMRRLEEYVSDRLSEDLTLLELARLLNISVRQLSRAVRQEKGISVHRWIAERRLSEARRLLTETDMPVQDIARRSAFHSVSAFTSAFRAASGFAPSEFRRLRLQ